MTDNEDVFELLGERGKTLQAAIQELLLRLEDDDYAPLAVVAAFSQVSVNMAATLDPASIEQVARAFEGYSRQLRELAQAKNVGN